MSRYTIFLPAPSYSDLKRDVRRTWVVEEQRLDIPGSQPAVDVPDDGMEIDEEPLKDTRKQKRDERHPSTPPKSLEVPRIPKDESIGDASALPFTQRLSKLYEGAVIREDDLDEEYAFSQADGLSEDSDAYEWSTSIRDPEISTQGSMASLGQSDTHELPPSSSYPHPEESQDTSMGDESSEDVTRDSSDASIARLPTFGIPINHLESIRRIMQLKSAREMSDSKKISVLAGILDIDGPDYIRIKKGADAGLEVALLKIAIGDEDGGICKVTVWRELAEEWGQLLSRGDVVLFRDILFTIHSDGTGSCTASGNAKSIATICYRTVPLVPDDKRFRPDLRIGMYDPAIAKVACVVRWVQQMGGINVGA